MHRPPTSRPRSRSCRIPLLALALTVAAGLVLTACVETGPERVALGVVASANFVDAAVIAIEHELERGPIEGLDTFFVAEGTSRSEPALRFAEELVSRPGLVAVVGHANSAASIAASQIYNQAEVVQIAPTSTAPLYREAGRYSFRMVAGDEAQGRFLADALSDSVPDGTRIAILYVNDDYGRGLHRILADELSGRPLQVVLELPHTEQSETPLDLSHLGSALEDAQPEVVVWLGRQHTLDLAIGTIRSVLGDIQIWGSDGVSTAYWYTPGDLDPGWEGVVMVDFLHGETSEGFVRLNDDFLARFGSRINASEALTYDAVRLVLDALRQGIRSGPELRTYLSELGDSRAAYSGITGPIQFDSVGDGPAAYQLRTYPPDPDR